MHSLLQITTPSAFTRLLRCCSSYPSPENRPQEKEKEEQKKETAKELDEGMLKTAGRVVHSAASREATESRERSNIPQIRESAVSGFSDSRPAVVGTNDTVSTDCMSNTRTTRSFNSRSTAASAECTDDIGRARGRRRYAVVRGWRGGGAGR
ncbi:uncharacterized protein LOC143904325 isoform X1 [Temnothorax americanus]|uniref:uncharacterized protein LOC143904325 isoform X1 n=1 Tax=Temnothorax americanus TaxID=1964332 RepID=UPI0040676084